MFVAVCLYGENWAIGKKIIIIKIKTPRQSECATCAKAAVSTNAEELNEGDFMISCHYETESVLYCWNQDESSKETDCSSVHNMQTKSFRMIYWVNNFS